ncbi:hypothetical protein HanXRQr2_Chr17g0824101 [Helianthus annuus]|uniref:Uncharacterized protein n=1 Tax=Helianthus annuus TaxID=4232 RepID=A0A9K3DL17_HELAN|nr:hypothetical protein HanXRQr2_Chr17g0824101 [Helianthus annuus]
MEVMVMMYNPTINVIQGVFVMEVMVMMYNPTINAMQLLLRLSIMYNCLCIMLFKYYVQIQIDA